MQQVNEPLDEQLIDKLQSKVTHLSWSNPTVTEDDCVLIQRELDKNKTLTSLSFGFCNLSTAKIQILVDCTNLLTLDLSNNDIGAPNTEILSYQSHLLSLILWNTNITTQGARIIARNNSTLTNLDVSKNNIDNAGLTALLQIPTLRRLRFVDNKPNIVSSLPFNSTLRHIDLSNNVVTPGALNNLLQFSSLTSLVFQENNLSAAEAPLFALNTSLTILKLFRNSMGPEGAKILALNPSLVSLDLSENNVGMEGAKALSKNTILTHLNISPYQEIDDDVQTELHQALNRNRNTAHKRKEEFIWKTIVLARDAKNSDSKSLWHNFPLDIRFYILLHMNLSGSSWIGYSKETVQNMTRFIFDNIHIFNSFLQEPIASTGKIFIGKTTLTKYPFRFFQKAEVVVVEQEEKKDNSEETAPSFNS